MEFVEVWTKYKNLSKEWRVVNFENNLGFSLYAISSTCYVVATLGKVKWSLRSLVLIRTNMIL